jgi:hypothetical protein
MKSKQMWTVLAAVALVGVLGVPAQAATFTVDTLIGAIDSANSGQAYEQAQLELACSCTVTLLSNVSSGFTVQQDDAGNNFLDVAPSTPGYFLLKFGAPAGSIDMFFFQNIAELTKLVWTNSQLTGAGLPADHVQSISHYAITSSTSNTPSVPEPGTLALLGSGLISMAAFGRRRIHKQ